ncbi:hypothetical protein [Tritonibacter mobilis]|uniref:hypothetical protein n=1 Tax=Tritonibacter mobilis TaxID=379347 RepID=UPI000F7F7D3B|nr:hypothetical protein [Tritonibacter mobilis]
MSKYPDFTHEIGAQVKMIESDEQGKVIGRAEYDHCEPGYLVRYKAATGRQVESWWTQSATVAV